MRATAFRKGHQGFHRHGFDNAHILVGYFAARLHGRTGNAVRRRRHLGAIVNPIADHDFSQPFATGRSGHAADYQAQRIAVLIRDRFIVKRPGDQRFIFEGLGDGHAAGNRLLFGVAAQMGVGAVVADVDRIVLNAAVLQHILKSHARPPGTADGAACPLIAPGGRIEFAAAIAATFQGQRVAVVFEAGF